MCVSRSISVPLQCFAVIALLPVFGVIAPALCLADEAVDFVRQGTIERITDHVAGDYQFSMYAGFDCFRMSADGSKVLFYTKANDLSTETLRVINTDGTNETIVYSDPPTSETLNLAHQIVVLFILVIAIGRIAPIALLNRLHEGPLVAHNGIEPQLTLRKQAEYFPPDLRIIVLCVKRDRCLAVLRLHRRHAFEIGVPQQLGPEGIQTKAQLLRVLHVEVAQHEILRTPRSTCPNAPPAIKQYRVARLVHEIVEHRKLFRGPLVRRHRGLPRSETPPASRRAGR